MTDSIRDYCAQLSDKHEKINLLDLGVGNGRTRMYLEAAGLSDRINFYGVDNCPNRLASVHARQSWTFLEQCDLEQGIPASLSSHSFDIIVCEQLLEHLQKPSELVRDAVKLLRPGGLLILGVPIFPPPFNRIRKDVVPKIDRWFGRERGHVQAFSLGSFLKMLRGVDGLSVVAVRGFRIISGGLLAPLEHCRWWWKLNRHLGKLLPSCCIEVQVVVRRA